MARALDGVDWGAIRTAVLKGATYGDVARAHGIKEATIRMRSNRENWRAGTAAGKIAQSVSARIPQLADRAADKVAERVGQSMSDAIVGLVSRAVDQGRQIMDRAHAIAMTSESPADMKNATISWGIAHQHQRLALGMDKADGGRLVQPWAQPANVIDVQTVAPAEPPPQASEAKPIDV